MRPAPSAVKSGVAAGKELVRWSAAAAAGGRDRRSGPRQRRPDHQIDRKADAGPGPGRHARQGMAGDPAGGVPIDGGRALLAARSGHVGEEQPAVRNPNGRPCHLGRVQRQRGTRRDDHADEDEQRAPKHGHKIASFRPGYQRAESCGRNPAWIRAEFCISSGRAAGSQGTRATSCARPPAGSGQGPGLARGRSDRGLSPGAP